MRKNQNGFGLVEGLLILIVICVVGLLGWLVWHKHQLATAPSASKTSNSSTPLHSVTNSSGIYWLMEDWAVAKLQDAGMSSTELSYFFNNPNTLLIHQNLSGTKTSINVEQELPNATLVSSFASYAKLQQEFASNGISSNTKYILYDNENWSATPASEQSDPIGYEQKVESLVHQHGMKLIFTPAADLAHVLAGTTGDAKYDAYLKLGIASKGATYTDIFEIQAQQDEGLSGFNPFVATAINQIKQSNPNCIILVGIGSNPGGRTVSAQTIVDDYNNVKDTAKGFWFNIPGKNSQPQVALSFFNTIYQQSHD